jgi:hypothetical protein
VSVLTLALRKMNNTRLSGDYAIRLYPHADELGPQLRPPVYGLLSRFALEVGSVDEACGYLLKVPMQDRRPLAFSEVAKYCVERKRPDLVVSLLDGSPSLSPELIAHTIASFARSGLFVQALAYESVLSEEMSVHNRTLSWGFPFLLLSAAHKGFEGAARRIMGDMTAKWNIVPSELDFNLALFAHLKAGLAGVAEGPNGFSEIFGLLYRMKTLGYGLHPILTDFDTNHPSIPPSFRDILGGVKMSMSLLKSVQQPSAEVSVAGKADGPAAGSGSGSGSGPASGASGIDRLLSSSLAISAERRGGLFPFPPLDSSFSASASSSSSASTSSTGGRSKVQGPDFTPSDLMKLAFDSDDVSATSSSSSSRDSDADTDRDRDRDYDDPDYSSSAGETYSEGPTIPGSVQDPDTEMPRNSPVSQNTAPDDRTRTRVWNPTNLKNIGTDLPQDTVKKGPRKAASWPLRPNFMTAKDDDLEESQDGDSEGEDQSESESAYSSNDETDIDSRDSEGEGEGEVLSGYYFGEADWLQRKMSLVNFSPAELSNMRLMDSLVLFPSPTDQYSSPNLNENGYFETGADYFPRATAGTTHFIVIFINVCMRYCVCCVLSFSACV